MVLELAMCCLNIVQKKAQCTGAYAARFCPEYTLWAEQQASGTCSVVSQIKAVFTSVTRALLRSLLPEKLRRLHHLSFLLLLSLPRWLTASLGRFMTSLSSHVQVNKTHPLPNFKDKRQHKWDYSGWHFSTTAQSALLQFFLFFFKLCSGEAACWSHLREGPVACQRSWSEWEGNNVYCYIFCFLSLHLHRLTAARLFHSFFYFYKIHFLLLSIINTFLYQPYTPIPFPGTTASFPKILLVLCYFSVLEWSVKI